MWQPVFMISGYILSILGAIMLIPAGVDMAYANVEWSHFSSSAMITIFVGFSLFLSNYTKIERISLKQGYLITTVSWLLVGIFAAIPFLLYNCVNGAAEAFFEAMSGISGTGATIMTDVESLPKAILLWRSILNGVGGLGIVIFAVALLPFLGIGGMQIFQRENSDSNDKFMPKFSYIAKRIMLVYFILITFCTASLYFVGMDWFDAINHSLSAIGTGGFSTKNASIGYFNSLPIEIVLMIFMIAGALPMTFYILLLRRGNFNKYGQVSAFLKVILLSCVCVGLFLYFNSEYSLGKAFRYSFFNLISVMTTTGLSSCDFTAWGVWITGVILLLSLSGGCTGSTSGSVKIFRWQTVKAFLKKNILSAIEPNRVIPLKIGDINVSEGVTTSVFIYVFSFIISLVFITVAVNLCGFDFSTSIASVMACITNVGVGAVNVVGPAGNFAFFNDEAKYLLSFAMLLGRLEVITVLVIFTRSFWRS